MATRPSIGLIAGEGELPIFFAREARAKGLMVHVAAIRGAAAPSLRNFGGSIVWISIGQLGGLIRFFKAKGVHQAVMHGKVEHSELFKHFRLDWKALSVWAGLKDRSGEGLLKAVATELGKEGVRLQDARYLMDGVLAPQGTWGKRPDKREEGSIQYGLRQARALARMGVGQTVVVKDNAVVAVEAMEGTDEAIRRAGKWAGPGTIVIKVASPKQDWRFDVPTVGPGTFRSIIAAKSAGIVVEAGRAFLLDQDGAAALARKKSFFIRSVVR